MTAAFPYAYSEAEIADLAAWLLQAAGELEQLSQATTDAPWVGERGMVVREQDSMRLATYEQAEPFSVASPRDKSLGHFRQRTDNEAAALGRNLLPGLARYIRTMVGIALAWRHTGQNIVVTIEGVQLPPTTICTGNPRCSCGMNRRRTLMLQHMCEILDFSRRFPEGLRPDPGVTW